MTTDAAPAGSVTPPPGCTVPERPADAPAVGTLLGSHYDACVGCGSSHPTGLRMSVLAGPGLSVHGSFTVTDDHQGAPGLTHGGLLALAFDEVLGGLGWILQSPIVTGRLQTEYLRPVPVGATLDLTAEVTGVLGRRIFCRAVARRQEGGPAVARAFAVFVTVTLEHFRTHGDPAAVERAVQRTERDTGWAVSP